MPEFDERETKKESQDDFAYPRSVAIGVVLLSAMILVFLYSQLQSRFTLRIPDLSDPTLAEADDQIGILEAEDEQLRQQDSDEDGLTDYHELRVYGSSPFIADTDSDGLSDFDEVRDGTDPNCPQGQNCFGNTASQQAAQRKAEAEEEVQELKESLSDPDKIRQLLIEGGAPPEQVNALDDQTLQILANEAFTSFSTGSEELTDSGEIDPESLRQELISQGFSEESLNVLSDEELIEVYNQALDLVGS